MLGILAGLLLVIGLFFGLTSPSVGDTSCGSVFTGASDDAASADDVDQLAGTLAGAVPDDDPTDMQAACAAEIDDRRLPAYGAVGLAIVALIASFVASSDVASRPAEKDTSWLRNLPPRDE
jgi:hypothetical protein